MSGFRFVIPQNHYGSQPTAAITVVPDKGLNKGTRSRVLVAEFGDGYSQFVTDGINPIVENYNLTFAKRPRAEVDEIVEFFEWQGGVLPFDFIISDYRAGVTSPNEKTIKVICLSHSQIYLYDEFWSATAVFKRVYTPVTG